MTTPDFNIQRHMKGTWEECVLPVANDDSHYDDIFHTLLHQGDRIMAIAIDTASDTTVVFQQAHIMNSGGPRKSLADFGLELMLSGAVLAIMAIHADPAIVMLVGQLVLLLVWTYVKTYNDGLDAQYPVYKLDATKARSLPIQDINRLNKTMVPGDRILYFKGRHGEILCDVMKTPVGWEHRYLVNTDMLC
jgi:hypothetical protein